MQYAVLKTVFGLQYAQQKTHGLYCCLSRHQRYRAQIILLVAAEDANAVRCVCVLISAVELAAVLCGFCLHFD